MSKIKWVKETPAKEGWFWIKYKNKRKEYSVCPAQVFHFKGGTVAVRSSFNDNFVEGPNHGGPGLKYDGKIDKSIRFGPEIEIPE